MTPASIIAPCVNRFNGPPRLSFERGTLTPALTGSFADEDELLGWLLAHVDEVGGRCERTSRRIEEEEGAAGWARGLRESVFGPWLNNRTLKVFSWIPTQDRAYALRAADPSTDAKRGTPGADWLAFRGLGLMASAPRFGRQRPAIQTSGMHGNNHNNADCVDRDLEAVGEGRGLPGPNSS